jgi:hypothetical protein
VIFPVIFERFRTKYREYCQERFQKSQEKAPKVALIREAEEIIEPGPSEAQPRETINYKQKAPKARHKILWPKR